MCIVCIADNINRNVYMVPTTGYARVLLFMLIRRELAEERYRMFISVYILSICILEQSVSVIMAVPELIVCLVLSDASTLVGRIKLNMM